MSSESITAATIAIPDDIPHETLTFAPGEHLVTEGDTDDDVILIDTGSARVAAGTGRHVLADLGPGDVIGEVTALAGGARTATVEAITPVRVHVLTRDAFESLMDHDVAFAGRVIAKAAERLERRHMLSFLERLLGQLEPEVVAGFEEAIEWVSLDAGDPLFSRGDAADAGYFLISGRMHEIGHDDEGRDTIVREIVRDGMVGESGLFRGAPRATTVVAARDCRLVRISLDRFLDLAKRHPSALVPVIADLAQRSATVRDSNRQRSIAVCVTADIDGRLFCSRLVGEVEKLGSTSHLWAARTDSLLGRDGIAQVARTDPGDIRVAELLLELELEHTYLVCEADRTATEWTLRLARQADLAVAVIDPRPSEAAIYTVDRFFEAAAEHARKIVVVAHPPETQRPRGTRPATMRWKPDQVLHVRPNSVSEVARIARILGGSAVSLVLGGGGARGFAHVGVRKAMEELDIPIDLIGGSSIGSPLGAGIAQDVPMAEYLETVVERFSSLLDYTIPVVSLVKGERITKSIELAMSGWDFEDLWRPFFCMSTNLTKAEEVIHDSGDLNRAVRASVAIPGVIPPVADGEDLLVDGGVLNNLPAGVMRKRNPTGTVIAVDVAPPTGPRAKGDPGLSVSGWQALLAKARRGKTEYPGIAAMLLRTMITASVRERQRTIERGDVDLYLDLDLRGISLLDFENVRPVAESGYEVAMPRLEAWLAEQESR